MRCRSRRCTAAPPASARETGGGLDGAAYDAQFRAWREAVAAAQAAITDHATAAGLSRYDVEMAVKRAVRHASEDPAE
ncbi:hypothetical protein SUDANB178_07037 [Streptomyces sp. enrichment culture]